MFISPMLARPFPKNFILEPDTWVAEKKYDGFRLITEISDHSATLFVQKGVTGWSRYGNVQNLPGHLLEELAKFPNCILDGEAHVPGLRSFGARTLAFAPNLVYSVFDILQWHRTDGMGFTYQYRRDVLSRLIPSLSLKPCVELAEQWDVNSWEEVLALRDEMWAKDQEGLILKDRRSIYIPGKRPKTWIKIKKLQTEPVIVIGFAESRGQIDYRGMFGITVVSDKAGNICTVTTLNTVERQRLEALAPAVLEWKEIRVLGKPLRMHVNHPWVGRELRIEFQERTPDGSWRHPRWDRWEDE